MGSAKSDIFQTNRLDMVGRTNLGETDIEARYFATLDIDYQSIKTKSPKPTKLKDKAISFIAKKLGSEVTVNLSETKVQALATVNVYAHQEPPQLTTP